MYILYTLFVILIYLLSDNIMKRHLVGLSLLLLRFLLLLLYLLFLFSFVFLSLMFCFKPSIIMWTTNHNVTQHSFNSNQVLGWTLLFWWFRNSKRQKNPNGVKNLIQRENLSYAQNASNLDLRTAPELYWFETVLPGPVTSMRGAAIGVVLEVEMSGNLEVDTSWRQKTLDFSTLEITIEMSWR